MAGIDSIARLWKREFGGSAEWHLRRKIAQLREWGDDAGADLHQKVLAHCEGRTAAAPVRTVRRFKWPVVGFRRGSLRV
ncbi:MAG: hypothetical protein WDN01_21235 [Rhizomicrobium sp.]